jgi:chromosomal replication initiation ATPase DnaA
MTPQEKANRILQLTCNYHNLTVDQIMNSTRKGEIVKARQQAMGLIYFNAELSEVLIAEMFGKTHANVNYAKRKVHNKFGTKYYNQYIELEYIVIKEVGGDKLKFPGTFSI